jgi:hypothetical protein
MQIYCVPFSAIMVEHNRPAGLNIANIPVMVSWYISYISGTILYKNWLSQLYGIVVKSAWLWSERSPVRIPSMADFSRLGKGVWVLDDGDGRRKGALAVYTPLGRACTAECCICNIRSPLRNSTWASGVKTGYLESQRALWTMSNRQVPPLVNNNNILYQQLTVSDWHIPNITSTQNLTDTLCIDHGWYFLGFLATS